MPSAGRSGNIQTNNHRREVGPDQAVAVGPSQVVVLNGFGGMCARLWWDEPLGPAAQRRLAIFASFPIAQIEVVRDSAGGTHADTISRASAAEVPVVEVER
jgi:hypothetical protein